MPRQSKTSFQKREKEKVRQQRQLDKAQQRMLARQQRAEAAPRRDGEDPALAGIRPGPQPLPEQWRHADELDANRQDTERSGSRTTEPLD
jgi:hypothetical protein